MERRRVLLMQVNHTYGRNCFLPYSVGCLQAYAQAQPDIAEACEFLPFIFLREKPEEVIARTPKPDVIGFSNYIWNEQWNLAMAKAAKKAWPECLVVFGGPQVPERDAEAFLDEHPYVNILLHREGELAFAAILRAFLKRPMLTSLPAGLHYRGGVLSQTVCTGRPERIQDLSILPSAYLSGVFEPMPWGDYEFHATQETHRGCPYLCTFCDWGSATYTKVRPFDEERLLRELHWVGQHEIELLYNADANYGLLPRDVDLTEDLANVRALYGFPKQFRAAYAKNTTDRIFQIAKTLHDADMSKGVTLSLQSTDPHTLEVIKRKNIAMDDFEKRVRQYAEAGIGTYTELILGLPGETYDSFADGVDRVLRAGQHYGLHVYPCMALPNSELSEPSYREQHGIRTVRGPLLQQHATPDPIATEMADIVIETKTMPLVDWKRAFLFAWAIQTFHCLGLTTEIAIAAFERTGLSYRAFYEKLLEYAFGHPYNIIGQEVARITDLCNEAVAGGPWGTVIPRFGTVVWPAEEASFLRLVDRLDTFYWHLIPFLAHHLRFVGPFQKQVQSVVRPDEPPFNGDRERYARDVLWFGRKAMKHRQHSA